MKTRFFLISTLLAALALSGQLYAISDIQYRAIEKMGQLNGVALQCGFFDETRRIKRALIHALPKRRQLGQAFEEVTNDSFMAFIESKSECPEEAAFVIEVDDGIQQLNKVFSVE